MSAIVLAARMRASFPIHSVKQPTFSGRHCEEPTGPREVARPDDRLRDEAIQGGGTGLLRYARNDEVTSFRLASGA
jgi:hypothetical protein